MGNIHESFGLSRISGKTAALPIFAPDRNEYAMVTVYGDDAEHSMSKGLKSGFSDKDIKLLTPGNPETLEQAAQNSVLVFIGISSGDDPNLALGGALRENRLIVSDIVAFCMAETGLSRIQLLSRGFDFVINKPDVKDPAFSKFMQNKITSGNRRLSGLVLEEEYRRVCDTLSNAPASMIVFDSDKRAVFVSDHYFRAYPRIADRLVRGISVYDAFELMAREEGLDPKDPLYEKLQRFWYNLEGSFEFTLDRGPSYRLKAVKLPNRRGILVMAQNVSGYQHRNEQMEHKIEALRQEITALKSGKKVE
jgi:hypothetical protein